MLSETPAEHSPKDLSALTSLVLDACGFDYTAAAAEPESAEYAACYFHIGEKAVRYRSAKITPTKTGQFVTLWKRSEKGPIAPFDASDDIDFVIVTTRAGNRFGQFIFPKAVLLNKGVFTNGRKEGKRAIRVYPPWDITSSKQAQKTRQWQTAYFLEIPEDGVVDVARARELLEG